MSTVKTKLLIQTSKLKVNSTYNKLVPFMSNEDEKTFDESVRLNGIREPIVINDKNIILDGHSRYRKAVKYKIESIPYILKKFQDKFLEKKYVIECNLQRRHLITAQKIALALPLIEIESKIAKKRQTSKLKQNQRKPLASSDANDKKGKTVEIISKKINVPASTIERGKKVLEDAPKELKDKVLSGKTSINSGYSQLTKRQRSLPKVELPKGTYDVILCDVPIAFNDKGGRGSAENHYDTMTPQELAKLKVPSAKNSVIFFWMPPSIMYDTITDDGIDHYPIYQYILDAWDFKTIKGEFVWNKEIIGLGSYNRNQHENCLIAFKGKFPCPAELFSSVITERRTKHSKKPESIYSMIEKMYPDRKYLELFGRRKRKDWVVFGNQLEEEK